jgi:hypothetical protein
MPPTKTLALEAESLIQLNRRLVPRKHVQLELAHLRPTRPGDGGLEECPTDALPPVRRGDHHPEICDVRARRVRVTRQREAANDLVVVGSDEDGGIVVATYGLQVPALVGDRPPRLGGEEPACRLAADRERKGDEGRRVRRLGWPYRDHGTTIP